MAENRSYVALGANQAFEGLTGRPLVEAVVRELESRTLVIERISRIWTTPAWPDPSDPPFTNAVLAVRSQGLGPLELMELLLLVEHQFGRVRHGRRNAPRTLDLDLLDFDGQCLDHPDLTLPHPRMAGRVFVLGPLCDIAPDWRCPRTGETASALLAKLDLSGALAD